MVAVSVTAYALSLIIKLYQHYGTVDADEIARIRVTSHEFKLRTFAGNYRSLLLLAAFLGYCLQAQSWAYWL